MGWIGMIRAGLLDQSRTDRALETVERNANSQLQLVEDLLDVSRIVRGDLGLSFSQINFTDVFTAAIQVMQPVADAKAIQLTTINMLANQAPIYLWGDADRLQQVILNLVSNAIKFTPTGGQVTVQLDLVEIEGHPFVQLQVQDTGIGIRADFLPYVFERFRQADSTSARSHKGLGLGLAIVQYIVRQHGGTIQAASPGVGQGATFTVKIPCLGSDRERQNMAPFIPDSSVLPANTTVLVIDDEANVREWLTTLLQSHGAVVIAVESVAEALKTLEEQTPTVLISDIALPYEDGYVLIQQVRRFEASHQESQESSVGVQIPAIALSAYAGEASRQKALAAGFQAYLAKPVTPSELIRAIVQLIENSEQ
ncbi:MAG: ATP-binding protein [Leptolyngbya sp. Prado105]|nr:ATP-binding protein [Leptolyngbya sp. Prado105]